MFSGVVRYTPDWGSVTCHNKYSQQMLTCVQLCVDISPLTHLCLDHTFTEHITLIRFFAKQFICYLSVARDNCGREQQASGQPRRGIR